MDPSARARRSKQKGSAFEIKCARRLSLWVTKSKRDDLFWRSSMSGGRATIRAASGKPIPLTQAGDLSAIDPLGDELIRRFFVECKNHRTLNLAGFFYGSGKTWFPYWEEPLSKAMKLHKQPMVIVKEMRKEELLLTTREGLEWFRRGAKKKLDEIGMFQHPMGAMYVLDMTDLITLVEFADCLKGKM